MTNQKFNLDNLLEQLYSNGQNDENPQTSKSRLVREGNITHIYKPEGTYTIIYSNHIMPQDPKQLPQDIDGLVLEGKYFYRGSEHVGLDCFEENTQYKPLFEELKKRQAPNVDLDIDYLKKVATPDPKVLPVKYKDPKAIKRLPIYFVDVTYNENIPDYAPPLELGLVIGTESFIGLKLLNRAFDKVKTKGKSVSRRNFLGILAEAILGSWLLTPSISFLGRCATGLIDTGHAISAEFQKLSENLHPEAGLTALVIRNNIIAHKEQWLMEQMNSSHLATVIGYAHAGLEYQIQRSPEDRLEFLKSVKPILEQVFVPESLYKVAKYDISYNPDVWFRRNNDKLEYVVRMHLSYADEVYEIQELKELVV